MRRGVILGAWLLATGVAAQGAIQSNESVDALFARMTEANHSTTMSSPQRADAVEAIYNAWRAPDSAQLKNMLEKDVRVAFKAATYAASFNPSAHHVDDLYRFRNELLSRHVETSFETEYLYRSLIAARRFDEARDIAKSSDGKLADVPELTNAAGSADRQRIMIPSADGKKLDIQPFELLPDYTVVVISHPLCHFSRNASRDIAADKAMNGLLEGHVLWLEPPDGNLDINPTLVWKAELKDQPVAFMYSRSDWPLVPAFETPVFYVFKGKTLVGSRSGWAGPKDMPALRELVLRAKGDAALGQTSALGAEPPIDISTLNLKRTEFDKRVVTVRGYLTIGPESLYVVIKKGHIADFWQPDSECLSLLNTGNVDAVEATSNGKLVEITGTFQADNYAYGISMSECGTTGMDLGGDIRASIKRAR
jgi:hypothetical protein